MFVGISFPDSVLWTAGSFDSFDNFLTKPHVFPMSFSWVSNNNSPLKDEYPQKDCLILANNNLTWIPVSITWIPVLKDEHEKVKYLEQWFEFL